MSTTTTKHGGDEWAGQFICPNHGPCTPAMVTTKKTCLRCEDEGRGSVLLVRAAAAGRAAPEGP